uniref:Flavin-containing monooxygenase n=1 Tax=Kalanchoe fedtschenkoi TaxID=63787 RepID=A0A7N0TNW0_KALFE
MSKQIGIIGAGVSGLLACKYVKAKGFHPIVFEAKNGFGGIWSRTLKSTKLQTPRYYYQFSDFPWPDSVAETFPDHDQVMDYLQSYVLHFNVLPHIKFNSKVVCIGYAIPSDDELDSWSLWGDSGEAFSSHGSWSVTVENNQGPSPKIEIYQVDFVILCLGNYSDLPYIPEFPVGKGPEVFGGKVIHSMDYAAMENDQAAEFISGKRVTVVGFQKSAIDTAVEVSAKNGVGYPCTILFRRAHWVVPEFLLLLVFSKLNRFSELMVHKPHEGLFTWLVAALLSPLLWISGKIIENYLKLMYPLHKYNTVPDQNFLKQVSSCKLMAMPADFYDRSKEGSLIFRKSGSFCFCGNGLMLDNEKQVLETDIVIFATGYRSVDKLINIFKSAYFQKQISESSAPLYRECIHPRIPQLAVLGYSESPANLYATEMKARWLSHFLAGKFKLPAIEEMEDDMMAWKGSACRSAKEGYKRTCITSLLQIHSNDQLCKDMGVNPRRKKWFLPELFTPYISSDYADI